MVRKVLDRGEIDLNSIKFKLGGDGHVHLFYASQFAPKQVIGDFTKDSDPNRSTWTVYSDQTGGIGIEDLKGQNQTNRSWWNTLNADYPGNGFLPGLATAITLDSYPGYLQNGGFENFTGNNPDNWAETDTNNFILLSQETTIIDSGSSSLKMVISGNCSFGQDAMVDQGFTFDNNYRGKSVTFTARVKGNAAASVNSQARLCIRDNIGTTAGAAVQPDNVSFQDLTVTRVIDNAATTFLVMLEVYTNGTTPTFYWDTCYCQAPYTGTPLRFEEFNGVLYLASGQNLWKLNATGDAFTLVTFFKTSITDIISSIGSCLYIFLGDAVYYQYMSTAEAFTETNVANAFLGIQFAGKLGKINTSGQFAHAATPNSATPTWTSNGLLDVGTWGTIRSLATYTNAVGTNIVYCATTKGLLAHDTTNSLWLNTELQVPDHTDNGKGLIVREGNLYYSAGSAVYEYSLTGSGLIIRNMGVDHDDGIPDEYVGSITKLVGGYEGVLYALVDASLISASNFSSVIRYDGAWQPVWADGTANETMYCGIASSVYAYRLWFANGSSVSWIALNRTRRNPLKTTSYFAASGRYISPWFDGEWAGNKLGLATRALAKGSSSTETVTIRYRLDKATTDVVASTAGWTTQDTLVAADAGVESVVSMASSVGVSFKTIQFRIDEARAAGTTTVTPNLIYLALEYEKIITAKWGWSFTLDCSETYANLTPVQQRDAIITLVESQTLVPFYYGGASEPKYVRVKPAEGERLSGQASIGQYRLVAIEK